MQRNLPIFPQFLCCLAKATDPNTVFNVWLGHGWKERMKISEAAKFESDLSKTNDDIPPQRRGIKLQTFQLWG